jgi:hypothetical protein
MGNAIVFVSAQWMSELTRRRLFRLKPKPQTTLNARILGFTHPSGLFKFRTFIHASHSVKLEAYFTLVLFKRIRL